LYTIRAEPDSFFKQSTHVNTVSTRFARTPGSTIYKQLSGEATREGAFLNFESESYKSDVTLTKFFPDSQSVSGGVAFDTVNMTNEDSWSFLTIGGGQIQTSAGQDDQVIATGGSSALAVETLTYQATATRNVESIHHR